MCEALLGDRLFHSWLDALGPHVVFIKEVVFHLEIWAGRLLLPYSYGPKYFFVGMRIQGACIPFLSGLGKGLFRSVRVDDESTRPLGHFSSVAESREEAMDTIERVARRLAPHQPANSYVVSVLRRIVDSAGDFDGDKVIGLVVRGKVD